MIGQNVVFFCMEVFNYVFFCLFSCLWNALCFVGRHWLCTAIVFFRDLLMTVTALECTIGESPSVVCLHFIWHFFTTNIYSCPFLELPSQFSLLRKCYWVVCIIFNAFCDLKLSLSCCNNPWITIIKKFVWTDISRSLWTIIE